MFVGGEWMLLCWANIMGLAIWGISRLASHSHGGNGTLATARERYARGEFAKAAGAVRYCASRYYMSPLEIVSLFGRGFCARRNSLIGLA